MKIHEYQAKKILKKYDIPVQDGIILNKKEDAQNVLKQVESDFNTSQFVIKAQIHAGGRGKGGGVRFCPNFEKAKVAIDDILGMNLVTHQTGVEGQLVQKVMVAEAVDIEKEFYVAITLDREKGKNVIIVSREGGVDIEEVAATNSEAIKKSWIDPGLGVRAFQLRYLSEVLGFTGDLAKQAMKLIHNLYQCYLHADASTVEINPLVLTKEHQLVALDAKFNFDDNALYRQKEIAQMRDLAEEKEAEVKASKYGLNYIKLEGNVGCMVNGAGLAMATMDIIKQKGEGPANFLDVGGGANIETVKNGFKIILSDKNVKAVLINIFGGIVRCDRVANGITSAVKELELKVPIVVRLQGTNAEEASNILNQSGLTIQSAETLDEAADKVVLAAKGV